MILDNDGIDMKAENTVSTMLKKMEHQMNDTKWTKTLDILQELPNFKRKSNENFNEYILTYSVKLRTKQKMQEQRFLTFI